MAKYEDGQVLELLVIKTEPKFTSRDPGNKFTIYNVTGHDAKGREHTVSYFYHDNDKVFVNKDKHYTGVMKYEKKYWNWKNIDRIEGFGGQVVLPTPFDDKPLDPGLERECYYEAFGDIHSAVPLVAAMMQITDETCDEYILDLLKKFALVCREARRELTKKYIEEKNNG